MDFSGISVRVMYYFGAEMSTVILLILSPYCPYHVSSQRPSASTWYLPPLTSNPFLYIILHLADLRILAFFHFINNLKNFIIKLRALRIKNRRSIIIIIIIYLHLCEQNFRFKYTNDKYSSTLNNAHYL